jgi:presenilin-like A22 family membrane protease
MAKDRNLKPVVAMGLIFTVTIFLAMITTSILPNEYKVFGEENAQNVENPLYYIVLILVFTGFILFVAKKGMQKLIQVVILAAVCISIVYVFYPIMLLAMGEPPNNPSGFGITVSISIGIMIGFLVTVLLVVYPEWYIINITGIFMSIGVTAILGFSMGILPLLILLIALAIYDAYSVYRSKHMVALADTVMDLRLPILLVIPKSLPYTFLSQKRLKEQLEEEEEREAMFMGLGDIIIPGSLAVSAVVYLDRAVSVFGIPGPFIVGCCTLLGGLVGFAALMIFVLKGKPQAGLPLLNSGAIIGYLVSSYLVFGHLGLILPSW